LGPSLGAGAWADGATGGFPPGPDLTIELQVLGPWGSLGAAAAEVSWSPVSASSTATSPLSSIVSTTASEGCFHSAGACAWKAAAGGEVSIAGSFHSSTL